MPGEAVRPRLRHLAALLEVPGRPEPDAFADDADRGARGNRGPRRPREVQHRGSEHEAERHAEPREAADEGQ